MVVCPELVCLSHWFIVRKQMQFAMLYVHFCVADLEIWSALEVF